MASNFGTVINNPANILDAIVSALQPRPNPLPQLIVDFAKHPAIQSTERGVQILRKQLKARGVSDEAIESIVADYLKARQ